MYFADGRLDVSGGPTHPVRVKSFLQRIGEGRQRLLYRGCFANG